MNMVFLIAAGLVLTLVLERVLYISGITAYTYYLTDRRLKGFPTINVNGKTSCFTAKSRQTKQGLSPHPLPMPWFLHAFIT